MTAPLGAVRLSPAGAAVLLTDDFTGWGSDPDWVVAGDSVVVDEWGGANDIQFESAMLVYWENNPEAEQEPAVRSSTATKTYTGLPANRLVLVRVPTTWFHGSGNVGFIGMRVNGAEFTPAVDPTGSLSAPTVEMIGWGTASAAGELTVQFAVEDLQPSFSVNINFEELTISTPALELADIYYDAGRLYVGGSQVSVTRGGVTFDPQEEWEDYDFPGKASPVQGCEEIVRSRPVLRTRFMLTGEYQFLVYRPGGGWSDGAIEGQRTYTLPALRAALSTGLYLVDVIAVWPRARGDFVAVHFPVAVVRRYGMASQDKDEGEIPVEIEARVATGDPLTTVPYLIHTYAAGTEDVG